MLIIVLIIVILLLVYRFKNVRIKFKTFLRRGFAPKKKRFGVYCYCGKQGKGKTYSVVEFLKNQDKSIKIYANIKTLKGINYTYFEGFEQLLSIKDNNCIIVYDEIFTALTKGSKMTPQVLSFLSQMRKREIIFLTTAQEWLEINITLRRYCRYQIECNMINFLGLGILVKSMYDAEQMKWSQEDNEYVAPLIETTISKCNVSVANSYDTFEEIKT